MPHLIDSDYLIDHLAQIPEARDLLARLTPGGISVSIVSHVEVYEGALRVGGPPIESVRAFLASLPVLEIDERVVLRCALIRHELRILGRRVRNRAIDLLIAATAIEHSLTLVTRNVIDYADIPKSRPVPTLRSDLMSLPVCQLARLPL